MASHLHLTDNYFHRYRTTDKKGFFCIHVERKEGPEEHDYFFILKRKVNCVGQ